MQRLAIAVLISLCSSCDVPFRAQAPVSKAELLEALDNTTVTFSRTAPGLGATELLVQPIHKVRTVRSLDDTPVETVHSACHALTLGLQDAIADLVPIMVLFTEARQANYTFTDADQNKIDAELALVLRYKQVAGDQAFTEFRDRSEKRHPAEGDIWFRQSDSDYTGRVVIP